MNMIGGYLAVPDWLMDSYNEGLEGMTGAALALRPLFQDDFTRHSAAIHEASGMTQKDLADALGLNERAVRFWERKKHTKPVSGPSDRRIEQVLAARGVILFVEPPPGARLAGNR